MTRIVSLGVWDYACAVLDVGTGVVRSVVGLIGVVEGVVDGWPLPIRPYPSHLDSRDHPIAVPPPCPRRCSTWNAPAQLPACSTRPATTVLAPGFPVETSSSLFVL